MKNNVSLLRCFIFRMLDDINDFLLAKFLGYEEVGATVRDFIITYVSVV